jgi:hypothetical protein
VPVARAPVGALTAVLTHLPARLVERQLGYLRRVAPGGRFVACHGGKSSDFDGLTSDDAIFVDDPSLRGPHFQKSLNDTLRGLYTAYVRDDPSVDHVYVIEYDHLILQPDFADKLAALAERTGAGLLAKWASPRNDTNWPHYLAARDDRALNAFVDRVSRREDRSLRLGCLGTGLFFRRDAFEAFCTAEDAPPAYVELFVPTAVHHLGYEVVDVDAVSDLYVDVRWVPEYDLDEVRRAARAGRTFVHPFKDLDALTGLA